MLSLSGSGGWYGGAGSLTHSSRTSGGLLGSKQGIGVGRTLRSGGGLEYSGSSLGVSTLRRFTSLWKGAAVVSTPVDLGVLGVNGGGVGGGGSGGLAALPRAAAPPSLSRPSLPLFPISSMTFSIARRVFLVFEWASNVSLERSLRSAFLLISASSRSCFTSNLRKKASSV